MYSNGNKITAYILMAFENNIPFSMANDYAYYVSYDFVSYQAFDLDQFLKVTAVI